MIPFICCNSISQFWKKLQFITKTIKFMRKLSYNSKAFFHKTNNKKINWQLGLVIIILHFSLKMMIAKNSKDNIFNNSIYVDHLCTYQTNVGNISVPRVFWVWTLWDLLQYQLGLSWTWTCPTASISSAGGKYLWFQD